MTARRGDTGLDVVDLVSRARTGDHEAFASIYDAFADRVFSLCVTLTRDRGIAEDAMADTFLVAWQRLDQLRDPEQLRAWLFAIARNRVARLGGKADRERSVDPVDDQLRQLRAEPHRDLAEEVSQAADLEESIEIVWEAAAALNPNERAMLELSVRQGLEGAELAKALGVTRHNANVIAGRMRTNLADAIVALNLLGRPTGTCPDFDVLRASYAGTFDTIWRKRVTRHVRQCDRCETARPSTGLATFAAAPLLLAPAGARAEILDALPTSSTGAVVVDHSTFRADRHGFPTRPARWLAIAAAASVVVLVAIVVGVGVGVGGNGGSGAVDQAAARQAAATTTTVVSTTTSTRPPTDEETTTSVTAAPTTATSTLPASSAATSSPPNPSTTTTVTTATTTTSTTTTTPDTAPPTITGASLNPTTLHHSACANGPYVATLTVYTADNRGTVRGRATASVGGVDTTLSLSGSGTLTAQVGPFTSTGSLTVTVEWVEDAAGNRSGPHPPLGAAISCA